MYCNALESIKLISDYIVNNVFRKDQVIAYVPIWDYTKEVVECAIERQVFAEDLIEIEQVIRPPYKSSYRKRFPTEQTIKNLDAKYTVAKTIFAIKRRGITVFVLLTEMFSIVVKIIKEKESKIKS